MPLRARRWGGPDLLTAEIGGYRRVEPPATDHIRPATGRGVGLVKRPRLIFRALQLTGTAAVFALASWFSALFSFPSGASFLFPPAGVSLAAGAAFGLWGVAGVVLGVLLV